MSFFNFIDSNDFFYTPISNLVPLDTLKIFLTNFIEHYKYGLGYLDYENIIFFITFIRFLILIKQYNFITALRIAGTSFICGMLWYFYLKNTVLQYNKILKGNILLTNIFNEKLSMRYMHRRGSIEFDSLEEKYPFILRSPIQYLIGMFKNAFIKNGHRIDPISMMVTKVPDEYKERIYESYYSYWDDIVPSLLKYIKMWVKVLKPMLTYVFFVRINKKRTPYIVRWHWTQIVILQVFMNDGFKFMYRSFWYYTEVVVVSKVGVYQEILFHTILVVIPLIHIYGIFLALLHAVSGQYFYIPFFTENNEIHIGKRPQYDIYSGGYASWQKGAGKRKSIFPKIWWGWFGRSDDPFEIKERRFRSLNTNRANKKRKRKVSRFINKFIKFIKKLKK